MDDTKSSKDGASKVDKNRPGKKVKHGGRVAGTPNKRTTAFAEAIVNSGFNLAHQIKSLYESTQDEYVKLALLKLALTYTVPVPKPREVDQEDELPSSNEPISVNNILKITNGKE